MICFWRRPRDGVRAYLVRPAGEVPRLGEPWLDEYLRFVAARTRPNTLAAHSFDLKVFFTVIGKPPAAVTTADVLVFIEAKRAARRGPNVVRLSDGEAGLSARTIKRRLATLSGLFAYLNARGLVEANPVPRGLATRRPGRVGVPLIRAPRTLPRVLEPAEVAALLAALRTARDRAMIQLMLLGGLRRCEVLGLGLGDIRLGEHRVFIANGKGGHQRRGPVSGHDTIAVAARPRAELPALIGQYVAAGDGEAGRKCRRLAAEAFVARLTDLPGWLAAPVSVRLATPVAVRGFAAFVAVTPGVGVDAEYVVAARSQWGTHLSGRFPASAAGFRAEAASLGFAKLEIDKMWSKLAQLCAIRGSPPDLLTAEQYLRGRGGFHDAVVALIQFPAVPGREPGTGTGCLGRLDCYRAGCAGGRLLGARGLVLFSARPRGRSAFMMASANGSLRGGELRGGSLPIVATG
jgi:integrase